MPAGVPYTFSPGTVIASAQVNANFTALINYLNGLNIPTTPVSIANGGTGSNTPVGALEAFGLETGLILPATASISGQTISLVVEATAPDVTSYQLGTTYVFVCPGALSGASTPILIKDATGTTLSTAPLYDSPGTAYTQALVSGQLCLITWSPQVNAFVLVNTPPIIPSAAARFAQYLASGTWTVPANVTVAYFTICGGGGAGGSSAGTGDSGGGGGGGAQAYKKYQANVTPGTVYTFTIGAAGAAATGAAGGNGGATTVTYSGGTLLSATGGVGGSYANNSGMTNGGAAGGVGGQPGAPGAFITGSFGLSGSGGGCLLGAGGPGVVGAVNGLMPGEYGGGGSGGGTGSGGGATGGNGAPGYGLVEW